jgi:DNA-binding response OmpR family regulator
MVRSVLIVEDDARIRRVVQLALTSEGFSVTEADTGEAGLAMLDQRQFDVVLVDLMLPGLDGFEVCRQIRWRSGAPVIVVTARTDSHDVVAGLEAGADDYVTKPFVAKELSARIRALLRRANGSSSPHRVHVAGLDISPQDGVVLKDGRPISLTRTEFGLLCELATTPGRVFSREDLLERVWGYGYFGDTRIVDAHVRRLRTKIEHDPAQPRVVLTVRGMGYQLQP